MPRQSNLRSFARVVGISATAMVVTATTAVATPAGASLGASDPFDVPAPTAAGASNGPGTTAKLGEKSSYDVTLITGDVVHVRGIGGGKSSVTVDPADPMAGVQTQTVGDDLYVFPKVALPYLAARKLDQDLFNVSLLIDNGYDDASRSSTPVIVEYAEGRAPNARTAPPAGTEQTASLESIDSAALAADHAEAIATWNDLTGTDREQRTAPTGSASSWNHAIDKIWLDGLVHSTLDESVPQIHAPETWAAGFDGSGTKVAVLDSGVDATHPDLIGQLDAVESFVPEETANDVHGHGTHVASTIAGTGAASAGQYKGAAPGTKLDVGKVLGDNGFGQDSWIIEGMEWAADRAPIVSMSVGSAQGTDGTDPMAQAVNQLSAETGALFVIAAGNSYGGAIGSPGSADAALTISAVDGTDALADFSSVGPRLTDGALKPDLAGPGVDITAARAKDSSGAGDYTTMSGTSMATPHVSGVAAMLLQANPDLTGTQIKDILMSTSTPLDTTAFQTGDGRVDARRSVLTDVSATGSAFLGFFPWPHDSDQPSKQTITYSNRGDASVTLALTAAAQSTDGSEAPSGLFALSAETVTVPAHGTASIDVTGDPALAAVGATYSGFVTATTGSGVITRTAIGLSKEAERYDLEINSIGRHGEPTLGYAVVLKGEGGDPFPVEVDGHLRLRLEPGTYSVMSFADFLTAPDSIAMATLGDPQLNLDRNRVVNLDLRKARKITAGVGRAVEATVMRMDFAVNNGVPFNASYQGPVDADSMYAVPTTQTAIEGFEFDARWRLRSHILRLTVDGTVLDEIQAPGAPRFPDGVRRLQAVDAGTGSPADLAIAGDLRGKLAIMTRSDALTAYERAKAADDAGAVALLVINDADPEFNEGTWDPDFADGPIPVAQISGVEGTRVLAAVAAGRATTKVESQFSSPFVYDLVDAHVGEIPRDLSYRPRGRDLARIDASYGAPTPQLGGEFRYDFRPWTDFGIGFQQYTAFPQERVEWVSVQPGTSWYQGATLLDTQWEMRDIRRTYRAGQTYESHWYQPIVHPRLGEGFWAPNRQGDFIQLNIPSESDGEPGHVGSIGDAVRNEVIDVYVGDELIASDNLYHYVGFDASPDPTTYKVVTTTETTPSVWPLSSSTRTEWEFTSGTPEVFAAVLPLLQLDYGIDTDLSGNAAAGKGVRFTLDASHLPDAVDTGAIRGGSLEVSYDDGQTWRSVDLRGSRGHWVTTLQHPKRAGTYVSIRASASDTAGNTVKQEVIRAYRLK